MSLNDIYNKGEEVAQKGSVESSIQDLNKENEACELSENLKIQEENEPLHGNSDQNEEKEVLTAEDVQALAPLYTDVVLALKQVYDPEIPVNVYDLGLIYELHINKKREVNIKMTFTAPNCPMADEVLLDVKTSVEDVPNVSKCIIDLVFEPAWDRSMLSEEARIELGMD